MGQIKHKLVVEWTEPIYGDEAYYEVLSPIDAAELIDDRDKFLRNDSVKHEENRVYMVELIKSTLTDEFLSDEDIDIIELNYDYEIDN